MSGVNLPLALSKNAKHYSLLQSDLRDHIDNTKISVTIVEAGTLEDLGKDFIKVNNVISSDKSFFVTHV